MYLIAEFTLKSKTRSTKSSDLVKDVIEISLTFVVEPNGRAGSWGSDTDSDSGHPGRFLFLNGNGIIIASIQQAVAGGLRLRSPTAFLESKTF